MEKFKPVPIELEPKRMCRFAVEFPAEFNIDSWLIQSITKPKLKDNKWENLKLTFIDPIGPSASHRLMEMVDICSKKKRGLFKKKPLFTLLIRSLDPTGVAIEKWLIDVEKIVSIDFGYMDYSNDGIQKITLLLKPSICMLTEQKEEYEY